MYIYIYTYVLVHKSMKTSAQPRQRCAHDSLSAAVLLNLKGGDACTITLESNQTTPKRKLSYGALNGPAASYRPVLLLRRAQLTSSCKIKMTKSGVRAC